MLFVEICARTYSETFSFLSGPVHKSIEMLSSTKPCVFFSVHLLVLKYKKTSSGAKIENMRMNPMGSMEENEWKCDPEWMSGELSRRSHCNKWCGVASVYSFNKTFTWPLLGNVIISRWTFEFILRFFWSFCCFVSCVSFGFHRSLFLTEQQKIVFIPCQSSLEIFATINANTWMNWAVVSVTKWSRCDINTCRDMLVFQYIIYRCFFVYVGTLIKNNSLEMMTMTTLKQSKATQQTHYLLGSQLICFRKCVEWNQFDMYTIVLCC